MRPHPIVVGTTTTTTPLRVVGTIGEVVSLVGRLASPAPLPPPSFSSSFVGKATNRDLLAALLSTHAPASGCYSTDYHIAAASPRPSCTRRSTCKRRRACSWPAACCAAAGNAAASRGDDAEDLKDNFVQLNLAEEARSDTSLRSEGGRDSVFQAITTKTIQRTSGSWVHATVRRATASACSPQLQDLSW